MREATGDLARLRRFTSFHARRIVSTSLSLASWGLIMLFAALRSHRQLHASRVAACALFFVAVANVSSTRAAEHTLTPSPQTVHIGYFLASIKPVLSIESGDVVTLESVASIVPSVVDQAGVVPPGAIPQYHRDIYGEVKDRGPGPHVLTGPIEVKGAMPGDVLGVPEWAANAQRRSRWLQIRWIRSSRSLTLARINWRP
jgi:hypothetical protein